MYLFKKKLENTLFKGYDVENVTDKRLFSLLSVQFLSLHSSSYDHQKVDKETQNILFRWLAGCVRNTWVSWFDGRTGLSTIKRARSTVNLVREREQAGVNRNPVTGATIWIITKNRIIVFNRNGIFVFYLLYLVHHLAVILHFAIIFYL